MQELVTETANLIGTEAQAFAKELKPDDLARRGMAPEPIGHGFPEALSDFAFDSDRDQSIGPVG